MDPYLSGFIFGFTIAIAIGPIALLILRAGMERGFGAGLRCAFGAATADLLYALIAFGGGSLVLAQLEAHRAEIELVGAWVMIALGLWLAISVIERGARADASSTTRTNLAEHASVNTHRMQPANAAGSRHSAPTTRCEPTRISAKSARYGYFTTLGLTLVNPLTILLFASFAGQIGVPAQPLAVSGLAIAVFLGSLIVQVSLAIFGAIVHRTISSPRVLGALNLASALGIVAFGVYGLTTT